MPTYVYFLCFFCFCVLSVLFLCVVCFVCVFLLLKGSHRHLVLSCVFLISVLSRTCDSRYKKMRCLWLPQVPVATFLFNVLYNKKMRCLWLPFNKRKTHTKQTTHNDGIRSHQSSQQSHLRAISKPWMFRCPR